MVIITRDYPYSIYHSDNYETIDIELLTNSPYSYHFDEEYITSTTFFSQDEELSVQLKDIQKSTQNILYKEEDYYIITLSFSIPFTSNDLMIKMTNVFLEVVYDNNETIELEIGELNYLFDESRNQDISLSNLSATHEIINGYNTIGGVNVELSNTTLHNIMITNISLFSSSVYINESLMIPNKTCEYTSSVKDCLGVDYYNFNDEYNDLLRNTLLGKNNTIELYLPLLYDINTNFIYEFSIIIEYEINNQKERFIIDNFPYMKSSIFTTFDEEAFHVYTYSTNHS